MRAPSAGMHRASHSARSRRELHVRGALRNGCSIEEIRDTLIQVAIYAGIPAGVEAFRIARKVFQEEGITPAAS